MPQYDFSAGDEITAVRINTLGTSATPTELSASRALDTWYQNTSGKTMTVLITVLLEDAAASGSRAAVIAEVGVSTPAAIDLGRVELNHGAYADDRISAKMMLTMVVPDDHYYRAEESVSNSGNATLEKWVEVIP